MVVCFVEHGQLKYREQFLFLRVSTQKSPFLREMGTNQLLYIVRTNNIIIKKWLKRIFLQSFSPFNEAKHGDGPFECFHLLYFIIITINYLAYNKKKHVEKPKIFFNMRAGRLPKTTRLQADTQSVSSRI